MWYKIIIKDRYLITVREEEGLHFDFFGKVVKLIPHEGPHNGWSYARWNESSEVDDANRLEENIKWWALRREKRLNTPKGVFVNPTIEASMSDLLDYIRELGYSYEIKEFA